MATASAPASLSPAAAAAAAAAATAPAADADLSASASGSASGASSAASSPPLSPEAPAPTTLILAPAPPAPASPRLRSFFPRRKSVGSSSSRPSSVAWAADVPVPPMPVASPPLPPEPWPNTTTNNVPASPSRRLATLISSVARRGASAPVLAANGPLSPTNTSAPLSSLPTLSASPMSSPSIAPAQLITSTADDLPGSPPAVQSQPPPPPSASGPRRLLSMGRRILRSKSPPSAALGGSMPASTASLVPPVPAVPDVANNGTAPRRKLTLMQALPSRRRTASFHGMRAAREAAAAAAAHVAAGDGQQPALHEQEVYSNDMDDYEVHETIGYGASAHVVLAKYKPTGHDLAIKIVDLDRFERCQIDELRKEIQVMSLCRHPHLLPVYRSFAVGKHLHLVMPLRTAGAVSSLLRHHFPRGMPEVAIATILAQVLQGVAYLHQHGLIHRDIKSGNILLDRETGIVQLGDFGVSSSLCEGVHRQSRRSFVGSLLWMAPEVMEQSGADARHLPSSNTPGYNSKADIYSLGITVLEMAQGRAPYAQFPPLKVCLLVLNNAPPTLDRTRTHYKYSRSLKDLIDQCLLRQPSLRPSAAKLQQLPFLKRARKPITLVKSLDLAGLPPLTATPLANGDDELPTLDAWDFDASYVPQAPLETIAASPFDQTHAPHTPWSAMGAAAASYESHGTDGSSPPVSAPGTPPATAVNSMPPVPPIPPPPSAPAPAPVNGRDRTNSVMDMFASPA